MGTALAGVAILTLMVPAQASAASGTEPNLSVTVRIYDYAGVSPSALAQASRMIRKLLGEAGIEVETLVCSPGAERHMPAGCLRPLGAADLVVRIMPGEGPGGNRQLGVSLGVMASVYYQEAVGFSSEQPASERVETGKILGYGAAHELGHLLLHTGGHSPAGIMRADWSTGQLQRIWEGRLHFTAEQAHAMRVEVGRRAQQELEARRRE